MHNASKKARKEETLALLASLPPLEDGALAVPSPDLRRSIGVARSMVGGLPSSARTATTRAHTTKKGPQIKYRRRARKRARAKAKKEMQE